MHEDAWIATPASADVGESCADVAEARACWTSAGPRRVHRDSPTEDARTWRCGERGAERACRRRAMLAAPFRCTDAECVQTHPPMPDIGEWECFERAGAVVCRGGEPAAGMGSGVRERGWICGEAKGASEKRATCIDLSPDPPPAGYEACSYREGQGGTRRVCAKRAEPRAGGACKNGDDCPRATRCVEGACLPTAFPAAGCWFDKECGEGRACLFATCVETSP